MEWARRPGGAKEGVGWAETVPGQAPAENAYAQNAVKKYPTSRERPAIP